MSQAVVCPLKHNAERFTRGLICLIPLIFSGCFDSQSTSNRSKPATGIVALSQFFPSGRDASAGTSDSGGISEIAVFMPGGASALNNIADEYPELIAVPDSVGARQNPFQNTVKLRSSSLDGLGSGNAAQRRNSNLNALAALTLNGSFNQFFSSVFKKSNEDILAGKDEIPNPFTEAKEKEVASQQPSPAEKPAAKDQVAAKDSKPSSTATTASTAPVVSGGGNGIREDTLIIGNFNGSGMLGFAKAMRVSDTGFLSSDGAREFALLVNSAAVPLKSSFYVDDLNGDGNPDLLVTKWLSLSGAVMLGDANNNFQVSDSFFTGFEPTVPSAGPFRDGKREILTVNMRSGEVHVFRAADRYAQVQSSLIPLVPDYLLHLIKSENSADFLLTAQMSGAKQMLGWNDDGTVGLSSEDLAADPLVLTAAIGADSVQVYQVGNYASIILTSQGQSFNVANLRLFPQIFLLIGDLERNGTTDVAIGSLKSFVPVN